MNPVNQKDAGRSFSIQFLSCLYLFCRPDNHAPREGEIQEISTPVASYIHGAGTLKSYILLMATTRFDVITTSPSIALIMSLIIVRTMSKIFWNWAISCLKNTVSGIFLVASILGGALNLATRFLTSTGSKLGGRFLMKSFSILALTSSSRERPPEPPDSFG